MNSAVRALSRLRHLGGGHRRGPDVRRGDSWCPTPETVRIRHLTLDARAGPVSRASALWNVLLVVSGVRLPAARRSVSNKWQPLVPTAGTCLNRRNSSGTGVARWESAAMNGSLLSPFRMKVPLGEIRRLRCAGWPRHVLQRCLQTLETEGSITRGAGQDVDVALAKAKRLRLITPPNVCGSAGTGSRYVSVQQAYGPVCGRTPNAQPTWREISTR
jgi:hypothetical protein